MSSGRRYSVGMDIITSPTHTINDIHTSLVATAQAEMAEYPQYDGMYAPWDVALVTDHIYDKWGDLMATRGTFVLVRPEPVDEWGCRTIYLDGAHHWTGRMATSRGETPRGCNTTVDAHRIAVIDKVQA